VAAGALRGDILGNVRWYLNGRLLRQADTGLTALSASRPLIEGAIRDRVRSLPNVEILDGYDIVGLCATPRGDRITGARVTSNSGDGSRVLPADLVVDASGRGSHVIRWLTDLGYAAPEQDRVVIDLTYSSRIVEAPAHVFGDDIVVVTARYPGQHRGGVMQRMESGRALITLTGVLGERPPTDPHAFTAYARTLATPDIYDAVRSARPLSDAVRFRIPSYVRNRFERLANLPSGLLVIGDAMCAFNPVYGQGMSVAAASAAVLRDELREFDGPDQHRYFRAVSTILDSPWGIAVGADLAVAGVTGPVLPKSPLTAEYLSQLQLAATEDVALATAFIRVTALVDPPPALLRPEIVERVDRAQALVSAR